MPAIPLFEFSNVTVQQHGIDVLRNLNWSILPGQQWAVLGPNGSGKSALAASLTGQAHISHGEIRFARGIEHSIAAVSFQLQRAFVAQEDCFFQARWYREEEGETPTLTARQILGESSPLAPCGVRGSSPHTKQLVRLLGLTDLLDRNALHLSTGEMRRTLIARALLKKPKILLLDEPFIGLDATSRAAFRNSLETLMRRGLTVIVFTTRPDDLPKHVSRLLFLKDGRIAHQCPRRCPTAKPARRRVFGTEKRPRQSIPAPLLSKSNSLRGPIVELRDVSVLTPEKKILDGIHWIVHPGERWALTGHNGAGKTTLLSLILGDHPQAFAQDVRLFGKPRGELTLEELKSRVGWASPDILLHYSGDTTVLELACSGYASTMGLYHRPSKKQLAHARAWLKYFALTPLLDHPFRFLSEGQQRLTLLVRALVKNPPLLILDEPCQGLDDTNRARVLHALDTVCKKNKTTLLYVSHYAEERPHCINHELKLKAGRIDS